MSNLGARRAARTVPAVLGMMVVAASGGCGLVPSTPGGGSTPQSSFAEPESEVSQGFSPITEPPRDSREVAFDGNTLWSPSEFQQTERQGPDGVSMVVLGKPSNESGGVCEVVAFVESDPEATAQEQMYGLAGAKELAGARDIVRESVQWPDAESAVLVRWTERTSGPQGDLDQRFAQLAVQQRSGAIVSVIAVAPVDEFEACGVLEVVRTLSVHA